MSELSKILAPNIELGMDVNKDDILAIAVSEHETNLRAQKKSLDDAESNLCKKIKSFEDAVETKLTDYTQAYWYTKANDVIQSLKKLGKSECKWNTSYQMDQLHRKRDRTKVTYTCTIELQAENSWNASKITVHKEDIYRGEDDDLNKKLNAIDELKEQRAQVRDKSLHISNQLRNLSVVERKARADIARFSLGQTDTGRVILEQISNMKPSLELPDSTTL